MQKYRKIHRSVRMAVQRYHKICCSPRLDKHKGTGQLRVAPKSKMKGFKNPNENPTQTFDLEPLWKPSWGGVLYRLGKNVGRRINCSQKCGKTARWHQKLRAFGALALEGGAWGGLFLSLFVVCPLILLLQDGMTDNRWRAVFVAICVIPVHFERFSKCHYKRDHK